VESVHDVLYKQQGVTDFLVVEKEKLKNIHIRLCDVLWTCYGRQKYRWVVGEKSDGFPKQDKQSSVFCLAQAILSQPLVLKFCILFLQSFAIIGASEPDGWRCL
jgi:hypothetical protein